MSGALPSPSGRTSAASAPSGFGRGDAASSTAVASIVTLPAAPRTAAVPPNETTCASVPLPDSAVAGRAAAAAAAPASASMPPSQAAPPRATEYADSGALAGSL